MCCDLTFGTDTQCFSAWVETKRLTQALWPPDTGTTAAQELGPRVWADLTRLLLCLKAAPEAVLGPSSSSSGSDVCLDAAALRARREILEGTDEAVCAFLKLGDVEGIHNCAVLAWNAGGLLAVLGRPCCNPQIVPCLHFMCSSQAIYTLACTQ